MKKSLSMLLVLVLSMMLCSAAWADNTVPAEYIGDWTGHSGDINLSFSVGPDGAGTYTFEQSGYEERYDFTLSVDSDTFSVQIPKDNKLGIQTCEGTYAYADGVLTLDVKTTMASGVFAYTVPCTRAEPAKATAAEGADSGAFPFECVVYGQPYTYSGYQIETDQDGHTVIKVRGNGIVLLKDPDGQNASALSAVVVADGETLELSVGSFTLHGSGEISSLSTKSIDHDLVFNLGTPAAPETITLLNTETGEPVASFNVADVPIL